MGHTEHSIVSGRIIALKSLIPFEFKDKMHVKSKDFDFVAAPR